MELNEDNLDDVLEETVGRGGRVDALKVLLYGDTIAYWQLGTSFETAIKYGHFNIVRFLSQGIVIPHIKNLTTALSYECLEIADLSLR